MFTLTEAELLDSHISHSRFTELVNQSSTTIHEIKLTTNLYGEFQFITLSARIPTLIWHGMAKTERRAVTLWGLGYHDSRERWLCDEWRWHEAQLFGDMRHALKLSKPRVVNEINERHAFCLAEAAMSEPVSSHARLFALFADLGDEDGATTMLEDMSDAMASASLGIDVGDLFDE